MAKKKHKRTIRKTTAADRKQITAAQSEEMAGMEANKAMWRRHQAMIAALEQLQRMRKEQGVSLSDLQERTGMSRSNISRLLNNPRPNVTIDTLERLAAALGATIRIELNVAK
jgi:DNA-binding Xre family transcriptional regulator